MKAGKLKQCLQQSNNQADQLGSGSHNGGISQASLGTINVIFVTMREEPYPARGVMLMLMQVEGPEGKASSKRCKVSNQLIIGFSKDDKLITIQPHDDALVVTT